MTLLTSKNIIALGIIAFLLMSFWTLFAMPMDKDGRMVNCPFMDSSTGFCQMTLTDHISLWQQTFSLPKSRDFLLVFFPLLVALFFVAYAGILKAREILFFKLLRNYARGHGLQTKLFDYVLAGFSDGLIRCKIYA